MDKVAEAVGVTYRVGGATLVQDVALSIAAGSLTAIIGPNGAGKSTLARLVAGELRPSAGQVFVGDREIGAIPAWELACRRAVLPQLSRIAFPLLAREVVRIGVDGIGRGLSRRDRETILAAALEQTDTSHLAERPYGSLSGGEQQRIQLARVLAQLAAGRTVASRQLLILDEPVASLDLKHQLACLDIARSLAADDVATVAILHDINLAATFADVIVAMSQGRVVAAGRPDEILTDRLLAEVFEVDLKIGRPPPAGRPFVLPDRRSERGP